MNNVYFVVLQFIGLILVAVIFNSCGKENQAMYKYADGNGNLYIITENTLEYKPISPGESSSGTYSGGEYVKKEISPAQYTQVKKSIHKAVTNKAIHIETRLKGSGLIIIEEQGEKTTYLIKYGSNEQEQIEKLLKDMI